jgi:glycosyltransferase involved in cell wall biosynthesis
MHSGWTFTTVVGLLTAKLHRRVAVLSTHESLTNYDREKSGWVRKGIKQCVRWIYLRLFDVVVVASRLEQLEMGDRADSQSVVVPHAVIGTSDVQRATSNEGESRIGFLGRLHPKKNLEVLIDALASLPETASLHVAGDGSPRYRESLVSRAMSLGVERRIRWLGFVDGQTKREFLASIDVLAMPSAFECFGVAAVEALSAGVPVVVSQHVGVADAVAQYRCGYVVAVDASDISRSLCLLIEDSRHHGRLSRNARVAAASEFSVGMHGGRLKAEYERALAARGSDASWTT